MIDESIIENFGLTKSSFDTLTGVVKLQLTRLEVEAITNALVLVSNPRKIKVPDR